MYQDIGHTQCRHLAMPGLNIVGLVVDIRHNCSTDLIIITCKANQQEYTFQVSTVSANSMVYRHQIVKLTLTCTTAMLDPHVMLMLSDFI